MTGQKAPIQIMNKFGNCGSYETVLKVETEKAELSQEVCQQTQPLPLKPDLPPGKHVLTYFWWVNFDCKKESLKGSIHTTHGIAFQEKSGNLTSVRSVHSITPSGQKSPTVKTHKLPLVKINLKSPPPKIPFDMVIQNEKKRRTFSANIGSLKIITKNISWGKSNYSNLRKLGYSVVWDRNFSDRTNTFTTLTLLTEFSTACEIIHRLINLSKISNMKYTHITVNVDVAEKYKAIWNNPDEFKDVIIHLGDFHAFMHFFSNC